MNQWDEVARQVAELCVRVAVAAGPGALARELEKTVPQLAFREVRSQTAEKELSHKA